MEKRLELKRCVTLLDTVSIPQKKVTILEHPQVADAIMNCPQAFGRNGARRQRKHHRADLAYVAPFLGTDLAVHEAWHAKREQKLVVIQKIQRRQAVSLPQVNSSGG